jgi:hypothetical protein
LVIAVLGEAWEAVMIRVNYFLHYRLIRGANTVVGWMGSVTFRAIAPRRRHPIRFGVGEIEDIE